MFKDWKSVQLGELVEKAFSGPSPTCEERNIQSEHEWGVLKTTSVTWSGWNAMAHKVLPENYWGQEELEVKAGDIVVTKAGPRHRVGVVAYVDKTIPRLIVSGKMIGLRVKSDICLPDVLAGLLSTRAPQKHLDHRTTGMAESQVNFANSALLQTSLRIPPKEEQEVISSIGRHLDTQIQKTEALIAKLEKVKEGLLHDLLTRGIDENGQLRPSPEQATELYKESSLGLIPREWDVVQVQDVGEIVTGSTPPSNDLTAWGGVLPFFTPGDIVGYEPLQSAERTISTKGIRHIRAIPPGSTLVVCIGSTIGKVALTSCEGATNQQINAVIPGPSWDLYFVFQAIRNHIGQIHAWAGLQAVPIVNKSTFGKMLIPQPSAAEQANISKAMRSFDVRVNEERIKARKLSTEKVALMDDLLTGHVRVTPLLEQVQTNTPA